MALDIRGTPAGQIARYLEALGGTLRPDGSYAGPGWEARLTEGVHVAFGVAIPRVVVTFSGDSAAVEEGLRLRAMRVGG